MKCQVPHASGPWKATKKAKKKTDTKSYENQLPVDSGITCPIIGFLQKESFNVVDADEGNCQSNLMDLTEHLSLPIPLFLPTFVKCGNGPNHKSNIPLKQRLNFAENFTIHECKTSISSNRDLTPNEIKSSLVKFSKGQELPSKLKHLETVMERYGCDQPLSESYVGGNLATLKLNDERYLIHSVDSNPTEWDASLCLTRMTESDMKYHPMEATLKSPFDGGTFYQIAVPRQHLKPKTDPIFATRQLKTTRVWKVQQSESNSLPIITNIYENYNPKSTLRCIDLNPYVWGEVCELRSDEILISENGCDQYQHNLKEEYNYCSYMDHPKTLVLGSRKQVVTLDTRDRHILNPIFSLTNELSTYYNVIQSENIFSFSRSSRDNVFLMGTESSLLTWDFRNANRPLSKTVHNMDSPPNWIASVQVCSDKDWLFLDSSAGASSSIVGLSWGSQRHCLEGSSVAIPSIEIKPRKRWTSVDTLDRFQRRGLGFEWCTQNRFKEMRSGLVCDKEGDGTIQIWQCTIAGDVFSQQLNLEERIGPSQQEVSKTFSDWLPKWMDAVRDIEEDSPTSNQIVPTEVYQVDDTGLVNLEEMLSNVTIDHRTNAFLNKKCVVPDNLEQNGPIDCVETEEWEETEFLVYWEADKNAVQTNFLQTDETFANGFDDYFFSSTPIQPKSKVGPLFMSTPAPRTKKNNYPTFQPYVSSTPLVTLPSGFTSSSTKPHKASSSKRKWDDF